MLFNSYIFLALLIAAFCLYYLKILAKYQVSILILASLVYYSYQNPVLVILLLSSCAINFITSYLIVYINHNRKKLIVTLGVAANLLVLVFFKYSSLFAVTFFSLSGDVGQFLLSIPLPIGISFFTFQGISLLVDVYKGNYFKPEKYISKSFLKHAKNTTFFISFFPQLVAGPIVKAHDFLPQISPKKIGDIDWERSFKNLVLGYFLKMVVADNLKDITFWIEYPYFQEYKTIDLLMLLFGYSSQIFADFAGYSLIAIGLAGLFGYRLKDNFNFPYLASSFRDFWKRWHISLSTFLIKYLYFPLGGNRKGKTRTYINLFIVMSLGGLWHGGSWSYMIWGFSHGVFLATERFIFNRLKIDHASFRKGFYTVLVFIAVTFAWLLFKLPDFNHVLLYLKTMAANFSFSFSKALFLNILIFSLPVYMYHFYRFYSFKMKPLISKYSYLAYGTMMFLIFTNSGTAGAFIYFQF
jgi:alginate O-acetyltransferase complex protein AlgI